MATVHKFQGWEKYAIIISTVDDDITEFVDNTYLINEAVSRAKIKLALVIMGNDQSNDDNITDLIDYITADDEYSCLDIVCHFTMNILIKIHSC